MNAGARPMDMATIATRDISVSPVSPYIGTRYRCLLSPLVLSILAVGRGETGARLRYEIFHRRREHYHFTSTPLSILFSFPSFLPSSLSLSRRRKGRITQLRIRCWRSRESTTKMDEGREMKGRDKISRSVNRVAKIYRSESLFELCRTNQPVVSFTKSRIPRGRIHVEFLEGEGTRMSRE